MVETETISADFDDDMKNNLRIILNDLYKFYMYFVASRNKPLYPASHLEPIIDEITATVLGDEQPRLCISMPPRHLLADSTPVLVPKNWDESDDVKAGEYDGIAWKNHGDLEVGDYVYGLDCKPTRIVGVSDKRICDRHIVFTGGSTILAHEEHLWSVHVDDSEELVTLSTKEIEENLDKHTFKVPAVDPDELGINPYPPRQILKIEKYQHDFNKEEGKCIEIDNPDGIYLVGYGLIPTHNSKSSLISEALPFWRICQDKSLNIVIITNTQVLAEKFGIALREIIKEHGHLFNIYLSNVKHSNSHIMFEDANGNLYKGSIRFIGAGGSLTGQDMDLILLDDPYKGLAEELTPTALQKKIDWYNQILLQRIEPQTRLIILHTRWVSGDLIGYLQENEPQKYKFLAYPALDENDNPLWAERYTTKDLIEKREEMGDRMFNAIYQQEPLDAEGDFFNVSRIHWENPNEKIEASVRAWDVASADTDNLEGDYTAGCFMQRTVNGNALITDIVHGKFGLTYTKDKVLETARKDTYFTKIILETGVAAASKLLFREWEAQLKGYNVEQAIPTVAKEDRAIPLQNAIQDGKLYISIRNEEVKKQLMRELYGFPLSEHDDIIDSMAHAYNYLFRPDEIDTNIGVAFLGGRIDVNQRRTMF